MAWQAAYVGVGVLLGEPLEALERGLGPDREHIEDLLKALRSPVRDVRARGLARVVSEVAVAIERARMRG